MIANRLKTLRKSKKMTQDELAAALGTSKQTIHRYENGIITNIPPEKVEKLAAALGTTPSELMGWSQTDLPSGAKPISTKRLPVLGEIACGNPIFATEEHESYIAADGGLDADFCLVAHGDSMIGARINDGDIVFIRSQPDVENGEIAAVVIDDEATLKRVYHLKNGLQLLSENPKYPPMVFTFEEHENILILGKAVAFQSRL